MFWVKEKYSSIKKTKKQNTFPSTTQPSALFLASCKFCPYCLLADECQNCASLWDLTRDFFPHPAAIDAWLECPNRTSLFVDFMALLFGTFSCCFLRGPNI